MKLKCARVVVTFIEKAENYKNCKTLEDSLDFAWSSVYCMMQDAETALKWLSKNVIGMTDLRQVERGSPADLETRHYEPCDPKPHLTDDDCYGYEYDFDCATVHYED